jgi:hypothetical protein
MAITRTPIIDDSGSGQDGTVIDNAWKQEFYNQIDALYAPSLAAWTPRPYVAGNYSGTSPLVWSPTAAQIQADRYIVVGKTLMWAFSTGGAVLGGSPAGALNIALPFGVPKLGLSQPIVYAYTNGVWGNIGFNTVAGSNVITLSRLDYAVISPAGGPSLFAYFTVIVELA